FNGDRGAVGRLILIGNSAHEVVGVMPSGFKFPRNVDVWTALRVSATRYERGSGPEIVVFGRLVPGATREQVQAELDVLGRQMDDAPNLTGMELRPRVQSFSQGVDNVDAAYADLAQAQLMVTLILLAIAANVAVLVYAR